MKNTKILAEKLIGGVKSFGVTVGRVNTLSPLTVSVASTKLRSGKELVVCRLPKTLEINDNVLILFSEDNTKAFLIGVL